jgi:hypothetical protein
MSEVTSQPTPETPQSAPGLSIQDLLLVVQTLQIVSQRGAVRAEEMETVGGLYGRLVAFLEASGALKKKSSTDENPATPDDSEQAGTQGE